MGRSNNTTKLTIVINGQEVKNNLAEIGQAVGKLKKELRGMNEADSNFDKKVKEFQKAKAAFAELNEKIQGTPSLFDKMAKSAGGLGSVLGVGLGIQGIISGFSVAYNKIHDFDLVMAELAGVTETAKGDLADMRDYFIDLGKSTGYTATEISKAAVELSKLGFSNKQIKESLDDVLKGTIAFQAELPAVAELSASTMNAFGKEAKETGAILNVLAAGANKTALGFNDYAVAMPKVSGTAHALNISLEETVALLGILRDKGVVAESAGTALRNIFMSSSQMGMSYKEALEKVANSTEKVTTATNLFSKENATQAVFLSENLSKIDEYTKAVTNQGGAIDFLVKQQMNTLSGQWKILTAKWESFMLSLDSGNGVLSKTASVFLKSGSAILSFLNPQKTAIEQTQEEQFALNKLIAEITSTNIKTEDRQKLITQLQSEYPGFLGNLDQEKVTNEELRDRLYEVNDAYIQKLALQKTEEKYKGILEDQADLIAQQAENQRKLFDNLNQSVIELSKKGVKVPPPDLSDLEGSYTRIQKALGTVQKQQGEINGAKFSGLSQVNSQLLSDVQSVNLKLSEQSSKVKDAKTQFEFEANVVRSTVGIVDNLKTGVAGVAAETDNATGAAEGLKNAWAGIKVPSFSSNTLGGLNSILSDYNKQLLDAPIGSKDYKIIQGLIKQTENKIDEATGKAEEERRRKAEENAKKAEQKREQAANKAKQQADKIKQQKDTLQKEALKAEEEFAKELRESQRKSQDEYYNTLADGFSKEQQILAAEYQRKKEDLELEIQNIEKLRAEYNQKAKEAEKLGDADTGRKFRGLAGDQQKIILTKQKTMDTLEEVHANKRLSLLYEYKQKELKADEDAAAQKLQKIQIRHNEELTALTSLETAKKELAKYIPEEELTRIKTFEEAKKKLVLEQQKETLKQQLENLNTLQEKLEDILALDQQGIDAGLGSIFTEEEKNTLIDRLNQVKEKISEVNLSTSQTSEMSPEEKESRDQTARSQMLSGIDLLGFSAEQWDQAFTQLDKAKTEMEEWAAKIQLVSMAVKTLQNAWQMMYEAQAQKSQRDMQQYEASVEKKKVVLKKQLDEGYINQAQYDAKIEKLEADAEKRKAEMEYKAAMQKYNMDLANAFVNTALGVTQALASSPPPMSFVLAGLVGAMGALQIGLIASNKPKKASYAEGGVTTGLGFIDETGYEVAGVVHKNEYVIPEWLRRDPEVADLESYIEYKRTGGTVSFSEGGGTSPITTDSDKPELFNYALVADLLQKNILFLSHLTEKGVSAYLSSDPRTMDLLSTAQKNAQQLRNNGKITQK